MSLLWTLLPADTCIYDTSPPSLVSTVRCASVGICPLPFGPLQLFFSYCNTCPVCTVLLKCPLHTCHLPSIPAYSSLSIRSVPVLLEVPIIISSCCECVSLPSPYPYMFPISRPPVYLSHSGSYSIPFTIVNYYLSRSTAHFTYTHHPYYSPFS